MICLGEGYAVKKQAENGQIKILSNSRLFQLLRSSGLEVPDTPETQEMVSVFTIYTDQNDVDKWF